MPYLSVEPIFPVGSVLNDLCAAVGQRDSVFAFRDVTVRDGVVAVVIAVLVDGIVEVERHPGLVVVVVLMMLVILLIMMLMVLVLEYAR